MVDSGVFRSWETARLGGLVANLLDMGRLDAGAVVVRARAVRPADLVTAALDAAASALAGHPVLQEGRAAEAVLADAQLAQTALGNILENAGKYAPAGSAIRVRLGAGDGVGWIEVEDDGPGFPEPIEPLFEKFARGVEGDGRAPGTGLGLAIARGFAQAQGGRVEACNRPDGRGACVRLTLPLSADQPA
jgi:two-component system sensor histidine kinase KdpD